MLPEDNDADDDHEGGDEGGFSDDVDDDVYLCPACPHMMCTCPGSLHPDPHHHRRLAPRRPARHVGGR